MTDIVMIISVLIILSIEATLNIDKTTIIKCFIEHRQIYDIGFWFDSTLNTCTEPHDYWTIGNTDKDGWITRNLRHII